MLVVVAGGTGTTPSLRALLAALPAGFGAHVLVQLHPRVSDVETPLADLAGASTLEVGLLEAGSRLRHGHVSVVPPQRSVSLTDDGHVRLSRDVGRFPVDRLCATMAPDYGERLVTVLLSDAGDDGLVGSRAVAEAGGLVLAEQPETATAEARLRSALAFGHVDRVCPATDLADAVVAVVEETTRSSLLVHDRLARVRAALESDGGSTEPFRAEVLLATLHRRRRVLGLDASAYVARLRADPVERRRTWREIRSPSGRGFLPNTVLERIRSDVLLPFARRLPEGSELRLWVPACGSGEEMYSLAMLAEDIVEQLGNRLELRVFATDEDPELIEVAKGGWYPESSTSSLAHAWRARWMQPRSDGFLVRSSVREHVVFATHDLLEDPPFTGLHFVCCRGRLARMTESSRADALRMLLYGLEEGGGALLGPDDGISGATSVLRPLAQQLSLYAKPTPARSRSDRDESMLTQTWRRDQLVLEDLLRSRGAACLYLDQSGRLLDASGDIDPVADVAEPGVSLEQVLPGFLAAPLRMALDRASRSGATVRRAALGAGHGAPYDAVVQAHPEEHGRPAFFAVQLTPSTPTSAVDARELHHLEAELSLTRANLDRVRAEAKAVQRALRGTEERLDAANDRLAASNGQLRTVNGQLHHIHDQLAAQIARLAGARDVMDTLIDRSQAALLVVDEELRIRTYNQGISSVVPVVPGDIGRPVTQLRARLDGVDLAAEIRDAVRRNEPVRHRAPSPDGPVIERAYVPFHREDGRVAGCVLSVRPLEAGDLQQEQATAEAARTRAALPGSRHAMWTWCDTHGFGDNPRLAALLRLPLDTLLDRETLDDALGERAGALWDALQGGEVDTALDLAGVRLHLRGRRSDRTVVGVAHETRPFLPRSP